MSSPPNFGPSDLYSLIQNPAHEALSTVFQDLLQPRRLDPDARLIEKATRDLNPLVPVRVRMDAVQQCELEMTIKSQLIVPFSLSLCLATAPVVLPSRE